jgi:hypothetical protein
MLRVLLAKGIDADTILAVAEAAEAEQAAADEARREKRRESNRARQKAWYDRHVRDNASNGVISCDNQANAVMQREDGEVRENKKSPTPPINYPDKITPSLPSEATAPLPSKPRRFAWPEDGFDTFWAAYPRKTDRKKCLVAFNRLRRADRVAFETVMAGVHRMVESGVADDDIRYVLHPTTFLNNDRFDDLWPKRSSPTPRGPPPGQRVSGLTALAHEKAAARQMERSREPSFDLDLQPFPTGQRHDPADAGRGTPAARRDEPWPDRDGAGTVHDFPTRRAVG